MTSLVFRSWERSELLTSARVDGGRLQANIELTLTNNSSDQGKVSTQLQFLSARDVAGLSPRAIKHMAPAPFARDAETTKLVHVEFHERDLPWRYTPQIPSGQNGAALRPWLVLLVGKANEITLAKGFVTASPGVLASHPLDQSHLWAHSQQAGERFTSRILSPRALEPQAEYIAVLVPAFNSTGGPMWHAGSGPLPLPSYHSWRFWTTDAGDFETLAAALHVPSPPAGIGTAQLHFRQPLSQGVKTVSLSVSGAITSQPRSDEPPVPSPAEADGLTDAKSLIGQWRVPKSPNTAEAIGLPTYGSPWVTSSSAAARVWQDDLNSDPRYRAVAGLGVWMAVEGQQALMDAAILQSGALREAGARVGQLALGLHAAGRAWHRHLPVAWEHRLRILAPMTARMIAADGGVVLDRITGPGSPLARGLFSSAAQRVLRVGAAHTRHLRNGNGPGIDIRQAIKTASEDPQPPPAVSDGLPHYGRIATQAGLPPRESLLPPDNQCEAFLAEVSKTLQNWAEEWRALCARGNLVLGGPRFRQAASSFSDPRQQHLKEMVQAFATVRGLNSDKCNADAILKRIAKQRPPSNLVFLRLLLDTSAQGWFVRSLRREMTVCSSSSLCKRICDGRSDCCYSLIDWLSEKPVEQRRMVNASKLIENLVADLDPRAPDAPARLRLCDRLEGVACDRLASPRIPIGLDFPTWELLRRYDKEWLLPGAQTLASDSITLLETNPLFIDAFMVGINSQFMSEMHWRDLAVDRSSTPLRMFWGSVDHSTGKRRADIRPLSDWAMPENAECPLGKVGRGSDDLAKQLVIAFRSDLFRRYPATLVYLVKKPQPPDSDEVAAGLKQSPQLDCPVPVPGDTATPEETAAWKDQYDLWRQSRVHVGPIFCGTITPEITFFVFDVDPTTVESYWLVLDEPPTELRFRHPVNSSPPATNSAEFAAQQIDTPTRVAWDGAALHSKAEVR